MEILFFALILLGIPFVLPIVAWVSARRTRTRLETLLRVVESQEKEIEELRARVTQFARDGAPPPQPAQAAARAPVVAQNPATPPTAVPPTPQPAPHTSPEPRVVDRPFPPQPSRPAQAPTATRPPVPAGAALPFVPPPPPPPDRPSAPAFDWEGLVGVKLFSAIAGIAVVIAAVLFLRYSIESGWLQPPVRVAIGILVAVALLVVCEMKAAPRYPVTANAMDAAALATLFATFSRRTRSGTSSRRSSPSACSRWSPRACGAPIDQA